MNRLIYIALSIILLVSAIGIAIFLVWPRYQEFSILRAEVQERRERLETGQRAVERLRQAQAQVLEHASEFEKVAAAVPGDPAIPVLYDHIIQLGTNSGLSLTSIGGGRASTKRTDIAVLEFQVSWNGSYENFKNFLDAVRRSARVLNVGTISVGGNVETLEEMSFTIQISAYALPS